ncbi:uncharacterized protein PRCAT00003144001 [Priceomyces carsonii]|uniref:uncharacterized protein n=1 Tax=Priceomyces carsonii TaxID=28549 RepID=UPI002EDA1122|nr:unnamed protein product [Priceomyces carsonii]
MNFTNSVNIYDLLAGQLNGIVQENGTISTNENNMINFTHPYPKNALANPAHIVQPTGGQAGLEVNGSIGKVNSSNIPGGHGYGAFSGVNGNNLARVQNGTSNFYDKSGYDEQANGIKNGSNLASLIGLNPINSFNGMGELGSAVNNLDTNMVDNSASPPNNIKPDTIQDNVNGITSQVGNNMNGNLGNPPSNGTPGGVITNAGNVHHGNKRLSITFHDPFDITSYPMTNPPLFDTTMMLGYNDGVPRRRGLSISNGQIGQIMQNINHDTGEHRNDDFIETETHVSNQSANNRHQNHQNHKQVIAHSTEASHNPLPVLLNGSKNTYSPSVQPSDDDLLTSAAGVPPPDHLLIYNSEVIYNPNNGPIPGTAAWKKERLLERNRIAASKCRQRKKQAQKQLEDAVQAYEQEISGYMSKIQVFEKLFTIYNSSLTSFFQSGSTDELEGLRELVACENVDKINSESLDSKMPKK